MKKLAKRFVDQLSYVQNLKNQINKLELKNKEHFVPQGHYYSPTISKEQIKAREDIIWKDPDRTLPGIDLNEDEQVTLLNNFKEHYARLPFSDDQDPKWRYYYKNRMYSYTDAIFLFCMLNEKKPRQVIEVGSGFSSALMMDVNSEFLDDSMDLTFIEPYTDRLRSLLRENEKITIKEQFVQSVDLSTFEKLEKNDILFIDSTHVSKTDSDVNFLFFEVLPRLKPGVIVHIHDVFYPFEYPKEWVLGQGRSWNEDYILRSFLTFNSKFKIILFSTYLHRYHQDWFQKNMPLCLKNKGGNIWLEVQ